MTLAAAMLSACGGDGETPPRRPLARTELRAAGAEAVAKVWSEELVRSLSQQSEVGKRVALQPLAPDEFTSLTARQRQQLYEWLQQAFGEAVRGRYDLVDPASLPDISRILESTAARKDWIERYDKALRNAKARINVICKGNPKENGML